MGSASAAPIGRGSTVPATQVALVAALLTLTVAGCGIESAPFIAGPKADEVDVIIAPARITFLHNENDNDTDEFEGYDLYYKLYEDSLSGCQPGDACADDRAYILQDPVPTGPSRLLGRDYRRMVPGNTPGATPNLEISNGNKGDEFEVLLDMAEGAETGQTAIVADWPDGPIELNRGVPRVGFNEYKSFLLRDHYENNDDDVDHMDNGDDIQQVITDGNLYTAVYALGYGIDPGSLQALYSEPVFLGYVQIEPLTS